MAIGLSSKTLDLKKDILKRSSGFRYSYGPFVIECILFCFHFTHPLRRCFQPYTARPRSSYGISGAWHPD